MGAPAASVVALVAASPEGSRQNMPRWRHRQDQASVGRPVVERVKLVHGGWRKEKATWQLKEWMACIPVSQAGPPSLYPGRATEPWTAESWATWATP